MADSMDMDFSELDKLAADLGQVPSNVGPFVRVAMHKTSEKVRDAWRGKLEGSKTLPHLARAISWDLAAEAGETSTITSEIGPERGKPQAAFSHLNEFGSSDTPGRGYGLRALEENQEDFERGLKAAVEDAEKRAGL